MNFSPALRIIFRLTGLGLIVLGAIGKLPSPWPVVAVVAGLIVFLAAGGGGC